MFKIFKMYVILECVLDVNGQSGEIKMEDIPFKFLNYTKQWNIPLTCIWRIKVKVHLRVSCIYKVVYYYYVCVRLLPVSSPW